MNAIQCSANRWIGRFPLSRLLAVSLFLSTLICGPASAQAPNPQNALLGKDSGEDVFVRDSALAVEKLALAQRMEGLKEWSRAAEIYEDIVKNYADRVVPSQVDKDNQIYQYGSVTPLVQERLAGWPQDALTVYRARYEVDATAMLEAASNDPAQLQRIVNLYFVTDAAKAAELRLIDISFERGEFAAAAWTAQRVLTLHPGLGLDKPKFLFRAALANHMTGNEEKSKVQLKDLSDLYPQAMASLRGESTNLAQSLASELSTGPVHLQDLSADSWPTAFGSLDRARIPQVTSYGGARLMTVDLEKPNLRAIPVNQRSSMISQNNSDAANGMMTGIMPVVDRGEMFFQDNANVYAVSLESDAPLPGWADTYKGEQHGHYTISGNNTWITPRSFQCSLTVTEDSVLGVMGQPDMVAMQFSGTYGTHDTRLVCLDRATGKQKWVAFPHDFPESAASLRSVDLNGSPLVVGDNVYVQGRGGKGMQFEDAYVLDFGLTDGKLKWACYIASANTGQQFWQADMGTILGSNNTHLAYSNSRVYALSNLGAVAAVDAYDGSVVWLNIYPRQVNDPSRYFGGGGWRNGRWAQQRYTQATTSKHPWVFNPVIVSHGNVFVKPDDSGSVLIYDAGTGAQIKTIPMAHFDSAQVMLGVSDEKLIIHNDRQVFCLDWTKYDGSKSHEENLHAGNIEWQSSALQSAASFDTSIMGRGCVTSDSVLIPTVRRLCRLTLASGKLVQTYPANDASTWAEDEGPGNVLATQDRLIIAGPTPSGAIRVSVYADLALATAKLDASVAAAPDDPAQRLRYADVLFAAGKYDECARKLDEAIGLLGGNAAHNTSMRDRAYVAAMNYAQKLAKDARPQMADLIGGLFDRAGATATTAAQKVNYRLSRAAFAKQMNQPDVEVKLYQQILLDPQLRTVPVSRQDGSTQGVGKLARIAIDEAIQRAGAAVYAPFQQAATEAMLAAAKTGDPEKLQAVAINYPNSTSAARALLLAADIYEAADKPRMATQVLRQAYLGQSAGTDRYRLIEAMARNYLRLPNGIDVAIARLSQGAAANPAGPARLTRPLVLADGRKIENVSFAQAVEQLRQYRSVAEGKALPDMELPETHGRDQTPAFAPENPKSTITKIDRLVVPLPQFSRNDRIITFDLVRGASIFAVGNTDPLVSSKGITHPPAAAAWAGKNALVWTKDGEVSLLSPDNGQTRWSTTLKSLPPLEVLDNAETQGNDAANNPPPEPQLPPGVFIGPGQINIPGGPMIIIRGGGAVRIGNVAVPVVNPANQTPHPEVEQIEQVCPVSDRVMVGTTDGRIIALDLETGKMLWQVSVGDRQPSQLLATDDFVVARVNEEGNINCQVTVFDAGTGQEIMRRPFGAEAGDASLLINLALSQDGMLVILSSDRLVAANLFEPDALNKMTYQVGGRPGDPTYNFSQSTSPEHLQIAGDKLIFVSSDAAGSVVRVLDVHSGVPIKVGQRDAVMRLDISPALVGGRFAIRCVGSTIYTLTPRQIHKLDLSNGTEWPGSLPQSTANSVRDLIVTKGHVIALMELARVQFGNARMASPQVQMLQLCGFSRATDTKGNESGLFEHQVSISNGAMLLLGWQVVDGGFYYLSADSKLHFLRGAAVTPPN